MRDCIEAAAPVRELQEAIAFSGLFAQMRLLRFVFSDLFSHICFLVRFFYVFLICDLSDAFSHIRFLDLVSHVCFLRLSDSCFQIDFSNLFRVVFSDSFLGFVILGFGFSDSLS